MLSRLENLSHVLVWTSDPGSGSVDAVELPRLQLAFRRRVDQVPVRAQPGRAAPAATTTALADAVAGDTDSGSFGPEEAQIFAQLQLLRHDHHADAHAVRLKMTLVLHGGGDIGGGAMVLPWDVAAELASYVAKRDRVSARCRLGLRDENALLQRADVRAAIRLALTAGAGGGATGGACAIGAAGGATLANRAALVSALAAAPGTVAEEGRSRATHSEEWRGALLVLISSQTLRLTPLTSALRAARAHDAVLRMYPDLPLRFIKIHGDILVSYYRKKQSCNQHDQYL
jgi:hypothetical protein